MAERIKIQGAAAKIQALVGTDSVPTFASNAIRLLNIPTLQINYLEDGDRADEQHAGMGDIGEAAAAGRWGQVDIMLAIKGAGADYSVVTNKPEWDPFVRAAGFSAVVSGGAGVGQILYTDLDTGAFEVLSLYLQSANKLFKLIDCIALPKWSLEAAKKGAFTFTVIGKIVTDPAENAMGAQTLSTVVPPLFHSQVVTIGAFSSAGGPPRLIMRKTDCDLGTVHAVKPGAGATDGLDGFEITDRSAVVSGEIEVVPLATFDPYTLAKQARDAANGTDTKLSYQVGGTQFNRVKFAFGQWNFASPPISDNSGLATWPLQGKIAARSLASGRTVAITVD
jgi:hypothetical protein